MNIFRRILPSYFTDKFDGNDIKQLQTMSPEQYKSVLFGTDEEAAKAVREFIEQQRRGGVHVLEATLELLSDLRGQTNITTKKEGR